MRALVTGGAGFIGSHIVEALMAAGHEVTIVDHLLHGHEDNLRSALRGGAHLIRADVTDVAAMTREFCATRPSVVYHLAAQIDLRRSVEDPSTDAHVNVGGTASVLEAARRAGTRRVVLASTAAVYGDPALLPTREDCPVAPLSPYGAGKAAAETYMRLFSRLHGLSTIALRIANVYGPRQDPFGESGIVAIMCGAIADRRPVTIFGDGRQTRDFVFVDDVIAAFTAAGEADVTGELNVGGASETTLLELAEALAVDTIHAAPRPGETRRSRLDCERAAAALGWRARTPLRTGLQMTASHYRAGLPDGAPAVGA
jgi:UDP-glucose 4-epimerase